MLTYSRKSCTETRRAGEQIMYSGENRKKDSLALHHDLLIEMGRIELAMENLGLQASDADPLRKQRLESRLAKLQEAVRRLSA
jgi:hypothetical protein